MNDWFVLKVETKNGPRIGVDPDDGAGEVLASGLSEEEALKKCKELSEELGIPEFDNLKDTAIHPF